MTSQPKSWIRQLSIILTGQVFSLMGSGIVQFSIIWWLSRETGSAVVLSLATIMGIVPMIVISPIAGVMADKFSRKTVMMLSDAFVAVVTLVFIVLLSFGSPATETVLILLFLRAVGSSFHQPAFEAAMPMITPKDHMVRVAAIIQMLRSGIRLVAPMIGALMIVALPLQDILLVDVFTALIAVLSLALIKLPDLHNVKQQRSTVKGYLQDLKSGFMYVYHWRGLMILILIFSFTNFLLTPMLTLMPLIVSSHFNGGAVEFGFIEMALALGILFGNLSLSLWGGPKRKIVIVNAAQVFSGIMIAAFVMVPSNLIFYALIVIILIGISSAYINSPVMAIIQTCVDKRMLGRVMSIGQSLSAIAMPISLAIAGPLAESVGLLTMVWVPGLISMLLGVASFFIPSIMKIEDHGLLATADSETASDAISAADPDPAE